MFGWEKDYESDDVNLQIRQVKVFAGIKRNSPMLKPIETGEFGVYHVCAEQEHGKAYHQC